MDSLILEETGTTPYVFLDPVKGILEMKGRCSPKASVEFYYPIISGIEKCNDRSGDAITANFAFEYFNSSSSKCLFDVLSKLSQFKHAGREVTVNWFYDEDDEDMLESGEDYQALLDIKFNFIPVVC